MAIETYQLSDFTTSGGVVAPYALEQEIIAEPLIEKQVLGVTASTICEIEFQVALEAGEKTALDAVVAAHTGVEIPDPTTTDGVPLVTSQIPKTTWAWERWTGGTQTVGTGSWVEVYSLEAAGVLHGAFWQVNTRKMDLRILLDDIVVADLDMDELRQDFQFRSNGGGSDSGGGACLGWLSEYSTNRWQFRPPEPVRFDASFRVRLKSQSGNKKLYRGLTVWRTL